MASKSTPPRLGRGLAALLGDAAILRMPNRHVRKRDPDRPDRRQPIPAAVGFRRDELESLGPNSISVQGVLQPILVRSHPTAPR